MGAQGRSAQPVNSGPSQVCPAVARGIGRSTWTCPDLSKAPPGPLCCMYTTLGSMFLNTLSYWHT